MDSLSVVLEALATDIKVDRCDLSAISRAGATSFKPQTLNQTPLTRQHFYFL